MRHVAYLLLLVPYAVLCYGQMDTPLKATMCELYEHPEQYAGKMVMVRASVAGNDLWIDDFEQKACPSWMQVVVVFPERIKPEPGFNLVRDDSLTKLLDGVREGKGVEAMFEGRFDAAFVWRNHKKIAVGTDAGYGKKNRYGGRIVLREVSDVLARPKPRR